MGAEHHTQPNNIGEMLTIAESTRRIGTTLLTFAAQAPGILAEGLRDIRHPAGNMHQIPFISKPAAGNSLGTTQHTPKIF